MEQNTSVKVTNGNTVPRVVAFAAAGCGAGLIPDQIAAMRPFLPQGAKAVRAPAEDRAPLLEKLVLALPEESKIAVSTLAVLGPDPAGLGAVLERLAERALTAQVIDLRVEFRPGENTTGVALLRAAAALGAAAVERAAEAARPSLPPAPEGRGRPRSLDAADVQKIAEASAGTSAAALAAELGVSRRTVQRYRARLREEA